MVRNSATTSANAGLPSQTDSSSIQSTRCRDQTSIGPVASTRPPAWPCSPQARRRPPRPRLGHRRRGNRAHRAVLRCRTGGAWIAPDHRIEIRQAKTKPNFDALEVWLHTKAAQYLGQVAAGRGDPLRADPHGADAPISRSRPSGAEHQHRGARDAFGCDLPEDLPVRWLARPAAMPLPSPKP
jgi:hypothetical protein